MVAWKSFNGRFTAKIDFSDWAFYVAITDADMGSVKSLHKLFGKYLDNMLAKFEQNCMLGNIKNFQLFGKKWSTIFEKVLTPFWKTFL